MNDALGDLRCDVLILGSGGAGVGGRLWSGLLGPGAAYIDVSETTSPAGALASGRAMVSLSTPGRP